MREDGIQFKTANEAPGKQPQFVVAILFDVGSLYITSKAGIPNVPGIVLEGALQKPSAISQRLIPDEGRSEIGKFSFDVVDINSDFTDEVRTKLAAGKGLRGKVVQLWCGFRGFDFSAFQLFQTQIVTDCEYGDGVYSITCEDITREQRKQIFEVVSTTLAATCTATDTTIQVADTTKFLAVTHGPNWADAPNLSPYYFKIDREIVRATGKTATTFTGCSRGQFNTLAVAHTIDPATPQERRTKVEEFTYLDLPAPKTAIAVLTGAIVAGWPANLLGAAGDVETDTNADGVANGWTLFINGAGDGSRVQTPTLPASSSPFVGKAQRLAITSVSNSNDSGFFWSGQCRAGLQITGSAYVRTNVGSKVRIQLTFFDANGVSLLDVFSAHVAGDSIAHLAQISAKAPARTEVINIAIRGINAASEFLEFDRVMIELGSTVHPYTSTAIQGFLPQHWHMGIQPEFVRFADFTGIGSDLWDLANDANGFTTRFEGLTKQDGKAFVERQLYLLLGAYSPIYSDGTLGLRRLPAMLSDATPVSTLTEREIMSLSPLKHDYDKLHNQIRVIWAYDLGRGDYTRETQYLDGTSVGIHGPAPFIDYTFRGLHSGLHTEGMIRKRLDAIRDAYSYPPQTITTTLLPSLNRFEMGDVHRLKVRNVRDFAGQVGDIDRSFITLQRSIDFTSGEVSLELFGSTLRPEAQAPSTEPTAPLPDAFYTSQGVALSSVVPMTGNNVNAGTHAIAGNADLTAAGAIFYHNADLVIPDGAVLNITGNVQLRVKGFITLNGDINGVGGGLAGVVDPGSGPDLIQGLPGFIGNSRGWDGIDLVNLIVTGAPLEFMRSYPPAFTKSRYEAWPELNIRESGGTLIGLPTDLRGTGGPPGGRTITHHSGTDIDAGGTGGDGGAGLAIICRGMSFGVSAQVNLSGEGTTNPALTTLPGNLPDIYPGAGGPGAFLIILDGNNVLFPNAAGRFVAKTGVVTQAGFPLPSRELSVGNGNIVTINPTRAHWAGYKDEQLISDQDYSNAALRIQYVPFTQTPAPDQERLPAPVLGLTVTPGAGFNTVSVTLPQLGTFDVVDIYAAITNNRAGAVLIYRGRSATFSHALPVLATRFYWAQTTRITETGLEVHSDFFPASATAGVEATTLNPGGWTPVTTASGGATMIATSSTIEKSGGVSAWDSQAYSNERYPACAVSFRANDATHNFMLGLNTDPTTDASYSSLDFAWYQRDTGALEIYENGSLVTAVGTYDATTQLQITYDGEAVRYYKNAVLQRTVLSPGLIFALDSSFYTPGGKALDVKFQPMALVTPANMFVTGGNCAYAGTTIAKVGGVSAWDSECRSADGYTEGAFCTARAAQTNRAIMFALNTDPLTDLSNSTLDYAWYFTATGDLQISESNSIIATIGTYTTNTVCAIRHVGNLIQYIKDGVVVRSVPYTSTSPLFFDSSFHHAGAKLIDVQYGPAGRGAEADPSAVYLQTFERVWETSFLNTGNASNVVVTYPNNGQFGGKVIRAQNQLWISSNENIPFDPTALYRITTRIRRTAASGGGNEAVFCGVNGIAADGVTFINEAGANSAGSQHYNCARNFDMSTVAVNTWRDFVGWFRGHGTSGFGVAPNNDSPTPLRTGVAFFRPLLILNFNTGNGTMECDFIKIERLVSPDDSDNSAKNRIVPDTEFTRATDSTYWWRYNPGGGAAATITLTGGAVGGYASIPAAGLTTPVYIVSRRALPYQCATGEIYTITIRARITGSLSGLLFANLIRHARASSNATFDPSPASGIAGAALGGLYLDSTAIGSDWTEFSGLCFIHGVAGVAGNDLPYLSSIVGTILATSGSVDVDMVSVVPGAACPPQNRVYTASNDLASSTSEYFKNVQYNSTSPGTITLPFAETVNVGARIYFEQINTGQMTIAPQSGETLQSAPNLTTNRSLIGRYARAYAEVVNSTTWRAFGQFA